jgi:hypothetical protein
MEECMKKHRADWMAAGSYGVMVHYLVTPRGESRAEKTADFNRIVDAFDLDGFIEQFAATGEVETAVILPDSEEQRVRIEPSDGTVLAAAEILHYRSPDNPDAAVRRLVLKPPAPSTTILLAYTVRCDGFLANGYTT